MDKEKAIGLFRLRLNGILSPLRLYGQEPFVDQARERIIAMALILHEELSDRPKKEV